MELDILASRVSDNFFYGLVDDGEAALIDPVDGTRAVEWVRETGVELRYVLNTHFHQDHTGGNPTVLEAFPGAELVVARGDADRIAGQTSEHAIDRRVGDGEAIELGDASLDVLDTPGHTPGHVSLLYDDRLFSGDTIFVGGAGNCSFGGDPGELFETFRDVLSTIGDDVTFFPGHDYAVRDLEFILSIEPDNTRAESLLEEARTRGDDELFTTTLGTERDYSPFFRYRDDSLRERLQSEHGEVYETCREASTSEEEAIFRTVRELRNRW
jgi:hydroxyacylglutathione hydrolase